MQRVCNHLTQSDNLPHSVLFTVFRKFLPQPHGAAMVVLVLQMKNLELSVHEETFLRLLMCSLSGL